MQKFLYAASRESSKVKGGGSSRADGVLAVAVTYRMRSCGQMGVDAVVWIVLVKAP